MVNLMPVRLSRSETLENYCRASDNHFKTIKADGKKGNAQLEFCEVSRS